MSVTIFFGRHGETADDIPGREKISGWKPVALDERGRAQARKLGRFLKPKGITNILASDTKRAAQTADIVAEIVGAKVAHTDTLRSWNMGTMEGNLESAMHMFLVFFEKHPDLRVPEGEKFNIFFRRFKAAFWAAVRYVRKFEATKLAVITHSQDLDLIYWLRDGTEPGDGLEFGNDIAAGGCLAVTIADDNSITIRKVLG